MRFLAPCVLGLIVASIALADVSTSDYPLTTANGLLSNGVELEESEFLGRPSIKLEMSNDLAGGDNNTFAVIEGTNFQNGTIEFDIASRINPESWFFVRWIARGFAGIAFRVSDDLSAFECIYLRPENGRVDDPERRSHAVQYFSYPDFKFYRLREEAPGRYEAPADIGPDEWIHVKISVARSTAQLFLNHSSEPTLIVEDLKHGPDVSGAVALFIDAGTVAHFSNLRITPDDSPRRGTH